jgi:hypothetical protein
LPTTLIYIAKRFGLEPHPASACAPAGPKLGMLYGRAYCDPTGAPEALFDLPKSIRTRNGDVGDATIQLG